VPLIGGLSPDRCVLTLAWGDRPKWIAFGGGPGTLGGFLQMGVRLRPYELEDWSERYALPITGDWVVREGATVDEKLRGVEAVLAELGRTVHFEKRRVLRQAIVIRGKYAYHPLEEKPIKPGVEAIEVLGKTRRPFDERLLSDGTWRGFCATLENVLIQRVIDETGRPDAPTHWINHLSGAADVDLVLGNLAKQTSLTFTKEMRLADVWFMIDANP
jgi:hypothetical protein